MDCKSARRLSSMRFDIIVSGTGLRSEMQDKVRGFGCNLILA